MWIEWCESCSKRELAGSFASNDQIVQTVAGFEPPTLKSRAEAEEACDGRDSAGVDPTVKPLAAVAGDEGRGTFHCEAVLLEHAMQLAALDPVFQGLIGPGIPLGRGHGVEGPRIGRGEDEMPAIHQEMRRQFHVTLGLLEMLDHLVGDGYVELGSRRVPGQEVVGFELQSGVSKLRLFDRFGGQLYAQGRTKLTEHRGQPAGSAPEVDHARLISAGGDQGVEDADGALQSQSIGVVVLLPSAVVELPLGVDIGGRLLGGRGRHGRSLSAVNVAYETCQRTAFSL